jgi:poly-gamma-glutamate synthesis protein (capsule biosynthesis protein)
VSTESAAISRRRRLAALAVLYGIVVPVGAAALGGCDDAESGPRRLTVSASGDLLPSTPIFARARELGGGDRHEFAPLFRRLRPYTAGVDLALCHLEMPITSGPPAGTRPSLAPGRFRGFSAPPELARGIARAGWDACSTASNHSADRGALGVRETRDALDRASVGHTGMFETAAQRRRPLILEALGVRVALLSYTVAHWFDAPERWSVNLARPQSILAEAHRARAAGADAVLVNIHWAERTQDYVSEPNRFQKRLVRALVRAPAISAVLGQGPHVVQPIRWIEGKPVVFSEGNLITGRSSSAAAHEFGHDGLVVLLDLVVDGTDTRVERIRYVPIRVHTPRYEVLPVGFALRRGLGEARALRASYRRTVAVVGRGPDTVPIPERLP